MMVVLAIFVVGVSVVASATGEVVWDESKVKSQYAYRSEFVAPSRSCSLNGADFSSSATVTFPSGKQSSFGKIILNEIGEYSVTYFANVEGTPVSSTPVTFHVNPTPADLWNTNVMVDSSNQADVPDYNGSGAVLLSANERAEARYLNPIYIGDNTSKNDLMTFLVAPQNEGHAEFESFQIVVEDYYDASNRLYIRFTRGFHEVAREKYNVNVTVSTDGKTYLGTDGKQYDFKKNSVANAFILTGSSFYGQIADGSDPKPISVSLDFNKKTVTVSCNNSLTFDLTDESVVGVNNAWKGVDSGLAYVYAGFLERLSSSAASTAIYSVDGINMSGAQMSQTPAPEIIVDDSDFERKILAKVGIKHNFLKAIALDPILGEIEYSTIVYKVDGDVMSRVNSVSDGFVPNETGKYYVSYTSAPNYFGTVGEGGYYLDVVSDNDSLINFTFGNFVDTVKAGEAVVIPDHNVKGGIGKISVTYSAKVGNNVCQIIDGKIIPDRTGTLVVTATCKDVIQTKDFTKDITVTDNDEIYFDVGHVPSVILVGDVLDMSNAKVYKYGANGKEYIDRTITFGGSSVTGDKISPISSQVGTKQIVVTAGQYLKSFDVVVKESSTQSGLVADYFATDNAQINSLSSAIEVVTSQDANLTFVREIEKSFFNISFVALPSKANFTHLTFTLYDTLDADNNVTFDIMNSTDATLGEYSEVVYNGKTYTIYGNFRDNFGSIKFNVKYDAERNTIVDYKGNHVFALTTRVDGEKFNGFEGNIRLSIDFCSVSAESTLSIYEIGEQSLKKNVTNTKNNLGPQIEYLTSFMPGRTGNEYVVPAFKLYDVLNNVKEVSVSIKDGDNQTVYNQSGFGPHKFTPTTGGEYTVTIVAIDDKNNDSTYVTKIDVADVNAPNFIVGGVNVPLGETTAPVVSINARPTVKATVGEAFNIAKITASDNDTQLNELKIYAYVIDPYGVRTLLCSTPVNMSAGDDSMPEERLGKLTDSTKEYLSFTAPKAGKYLIYYVVRDNSGLATITHYSVEVSNNG